MASRVSRFVIAAILFAYFWAACGNGVNVYFYDDDLMNLYRAVDELPGLKLLTGNLTPFTPANRPFGALYYRVLYAYAGLDPFPYRVVTYTFLILNAGLLYVLARQLSRSREVAVIAVLLGCYHHRFVDLYTNNGTIYDILCATLYLVAVLAYIRWRSSWLTLLLYIPAINSKEMAASLPILLFCYELTYRPPVRAVRPALRWLFWDNRAAWLVGLVTIFAARAKTASASAFYGNEAYKLTISWHNFVTSACHWFDEICYTREALFHPWMVLLIWAAMLALALRSGRRYLVFAFAWLFFTPLPVSFIQQRGFFVMYLPWVGWSLFAADLLVEGRDFLYRRTWRRPPIPAGAWQPERMALFASLMACLAVVNAADPYYNIAAHVAEPRPVRDAYQQLQALHRTLPPESKILILNDPFPADTYSLLFLVRLSYGQQIDLVRAKQHAGRRSLDPKEYNYVWDYRDNHFVEVQAGPVQKRS